MLCQFLLEYRQRISFLAMAGAGLDDFIGVCSLGLDRYAMTVINLLTYANKTVSSDRFCRRSAFEEEGELGLGPGAMSVAGSMAVTVHSCPV